MITPTKQSPMLTFITLRIRGTEAGRTIFRSFSFLCPPRVSISFSFSGSAWQKPEYRLITEPKMATDMPATTMVRSLAPSHTIRRGARADFGRLFSTTRHGSRIRAIRREQCHGNMCKQGLIPAHGKKGLCDQGRTTEDKGIDPSKIRGYFPKSHKQNKKKCPCSQDNVFFFFLPCKILFLLSGNFRHFH